MAAENEGKIMASSSNLCGLCDQHVVMQHCALCDVDMCVNCVKVHQKLPTTRDHKLTTTAPMGAGPKSTKYSNQNGACTKHRKQPFTMFCKVCIELGCDSCKTDHGGHSIQTLDNDPKLCNRVVSKHIQNLLDNVNELEEIKSVLEGEICAYADAIVRIDQWEIDLLKLVREKAAKIRKKLTNLKDERFKQLSDQVNELMVQLKDIDQSISQLTEIRRSMDFKVLSKELSSSQDLIQKLERYKEILRPFPEPISVDDVLSSGERLKDVNDDLDVVFSVSDIRTWSKGPTPVADWCFTAANGGRDLSVHGKNLVTMTNVTYGLGPDGEAQGAVVVPQSGTESMIVMNPDDKLWFKGEMTFFINLFVEANESDGFVFIYDTGMTSAVSTGAYLYINDDHTRLQIGSDSWSKTPHIITPNSWNKIAVVLRPASVLVYVNGTLAHTENKSLDLSRTHVGHLHFVR